MTQHPPGDGGRRPPAELSLRRHEEEPVVERQWRDSNGVKLRRVVESRDVNERHPVRSEEMVQARVPATEGDSGEVEVLPDGSISIPLFEEQLVVSRRLVLRERVVVRKEMVTDWQSVVATLRREEVELEESPRDDAA
jgi:uncharacterized protein (TIGR02271 family)